MLTKACCLAWKWLKRYQRLFYCVLCSLGATVASAQLPYFNTGPDSSFAQIDFAEMYLDQQNRDAGRTADQRASRQKLIAAGTVSALDLAAPNKAVDEYNRAASLLKAQKSREAIRHLEKAIAGYPKFVSGHNALGLAYLDQEDPRAKSEFETAAKLDDKFPGSFLNLGYLALAVKDFATAESNLEKAAALVPQNAKTLSALAFAQNGNRDYQQTLATVQRVHQLDHPGMANVHYLAASAALALKNPDLAKSELATFIAEDPTNPMAPAARHNLEILTRPTTATVSVGEHAAAVPGTQTFPNSDRLKAQLASLGAEPAVSGDFDTTPRNDADAAPRAAPALLPAWQPSWTIRKTVDETALFFSVSSHGHMISNLDLSNIQLRDNGKPPERIIQFLPQSKLPLRLGLLIDTSGSVQERFNFEKHAAEKFLEQVLNGTTDLAFVVGFNNNTVVTQDFSADTEKLDTGIEGLKNAGGTALFDAVWFACWKLAAYPEQQRVARVVVVLTDGEDNSSHRSLKQVLRDAEDAGVTIYPVSTREISGPKTDADGILDALAERTGGESLFPGDALSLNKALNQLHELIRSRYLLAYKPAEFEPNGHYRPIAITAEKDGKRLRVHTRKGYYARLESRP
jgi:Ca-activated chloride channel homolog